MKGTCQNTEHDGDRLVDRRDLFERRIEWRRLTDQGRARVVLQRRECRTCMNRDVGSLRLRAQQETLL